MNLRRWKKQYKIKHFIQNRIYCIKAKIFR